jgi:diguanylate cyclase (GGDEF)-like protein
VIVAFASELVGLSPRFQHLGRRVTISDLASNLFAMGAPALLAGVALVFAGDQVGHGPAFLLIVLAVGIIADLANLLLVAAQTFFVFGLSVVMPYLTAWKTMFPALMLRTGALVIALWVNRSSGPAAFAFAALVLAGIQALLARVARVEYALRLERDKVSWLAYHDALTGVWNRLAFDEQLTRATSTLRDQIALLFLDLNDFKRVNDTLGHPAGDQLLRAVAERLVGSLRNQDRVFRRGGDEFLVIAHIDREDDLAQIIARVEQIFENPFRVAGATLNAGGSLGVALWPEEADSAEALMRLADSRMYEGKAHSVSKQLAGIS